MRSLLKDIITNRFLLWGFIRLDLRNRYGASFLGFFWSVINPLLLIVLYTLIFGYILQINVGGNAGPKNYGLFLFSGMLPWLAISDATHRASSVILENRDLVKQVNFPKILLPFRCVVGAFLHELIALGVFLAILLLVHETPSILALGLLIAIWPLQLFFHARHRPVRQLDDRFLQRHARTCRRAFDPLVFRNAHHLSDGAHPRKHQVPVLPEPGDMAHQSLPGRPARRRRPRAVRLHLFFRGDASPSHVRLEAILKAIDRSRRSSVTLGPRK
ncbi:MAG: hypothetical protein M5R36_22605 [Deltaproteobacteria bacterium]|nr:hypothetical protein [Deltaproteobacteria bacterium]